MVDVGVGLTASSRNTRKLMPPPMRAIASRPIRSAGQFICRRAARNGGNAADGEATWAVAGRAGVADWAGIGTVGGTGLAGGAGGVAAASIAPQFAQKRDAPASAVPHDGQNFM